MVGDLNGDYIVNILDVIVMINIVLNIESPFENADINNDSIIDILDIVLLVNIIID